jgi:hypothetical protein
MLSFFTVSKCYHFSVIIYLVLICYRLCYHLCYHFFTSYHFFNYLLGCIILLSFGVIIFHRLQNVIIFVLSFFLVHVGCYHLCYHLMLSFFVIISPLLSFSWKRDTLVKSADLPCHFNIENYNFPEWSITSARQFRFKFGIVQCHKVHHFISTMYNVHVHIHGIHQLDNELKAPNKLFLFFSNLQPTGIYIYICWRTNLYGTRELRVGLGM